eukprot:COSAG06_NODE_18571_length_880_cov_1.441741_1_plen_44_part_10
MYIHWIWTNIHSLPFLAPKIVEPTRTCVAPSLTADRKSSDIPID